jgi:flagellar basal-body rod protein FlgB
VGDLYLFGLASRRLSWLTARHAVIADNIANANTPGHRAKDIRPFSDALTRAEVSLRATQPGHLGFVGAGGVESPRFGAREIENAEIRLSDNTVQLDQELLKAASVGSDASLSAGIVKSFHRMLIAAAKG